MPCAFVAAGGGVHRVHPGGVRLASQKPAWAQWSLSGHGLPLHLPGTAEASYPYVVGPCAVEPRFIALIPFTKLFHMLGAPVAITFIILPLDLRSRMHLPRNRPMRRR